MTHEKAISILIEYAGIQFDPQIVQVFVSLPIETLTKQSQMASTQVELAAVAG